MLEHFNISKSNQQNNILLGTPALVLKWQSDISSPSKAGDQVSWIEPTNTSLSRVKMTDKHSPFDAGSVSDWHKMTALLVIPP